MVEDECRIEKESGLKHIWYQKGKYPTIKVDQEKDAVSFYGALNVRSGRCHFRDTDWQDSEETVKFLRKLERIYRDKKVVKSQQDINNLKKLYYSSIHYLDHKVNEINDHLEKKLNNGSWTVR